jgi:hypothetical protein
MFSSLLPRLCTSPSTIASVRTVSGSMQLWIPLRLSMLCKLILFVRVRLISTMYCLVFDYTKHVVFADLPLASLILGSPPSPYKKRSANFLTCPSFLRLFRLGSWYESPKPTLLPILPSQTRQLLNVEVGPNEQPKRFPELAALHVPDIYQQWRKRRRSILTESLPGRVSIRTPTKTRTRKLNPVLLLPIHEPQELPFTTHLSIRLRLNLRKRQALQTYSIFSNGPRRTLRARTAGMFVFRLSY